VLAAFLPRQDCILIITNKLDRFRKIDSMKCYVNWIPLRICIRSRNTQPYLNLARNYEMMMIAFIITLGEIM